MREKIEAVLEGIRPAVHAHGGEVSIVSIDEAAGLVRLKFQGTCEHCALGPLTLKLGIEPLLKKEFSWITSVIAE